MTLSLNRAIAQCPRSLFGDRDKGVPPKFRKIFALVAKALLTDAGEKFDEKTVDLVANYINPSSMQRSVADHRATITGKIDTKTGEYQPIPEKQPKKERGKPRAKVDELGLSKSKKASKKAKKAATREPGITKAKASKKAEGEAKDAQTAKKAPGKPAKAPKSAGAARPEDGNRQSRAGVKLDALAAARASLVAKKKAKEKATEETVEI